MQRYLFVDAVHTAISPDWSVLPDDGGGGGGGFDGGVGDGPQSPQVFLHLAET
jgi:hypothetical protein